MDVQKRLRILDANRELNRLIDDQINRLLDPALDAVVDRLAAPIHSALEAAYRQNPNLFQADLNIPALDQRIDELVDVLQGDFIFGNPAAQQVTSLVDELDRSLGRVIGGINDILAIVAKQPPENRRTVLKNLTKELLKQDPAYAALAEVVDQLLSDQIEAIEPAIARAEQILTRVRDFFTQVQSQLRQASQLISEIRDTLEGSAAAIDQLRKDIKSGLRQAIVGLGLDRGNPFDELGPDVIREAIRRAIKDQFYRSVIPATIQRIVKDTFADQIGVVREYLGAVFQKVNDIIEKAVESVAGQVLGPLQQFKDKLNGIVATAKIRGFAEIEGDALRELRLDGNYLFAVTKSEKLQFDAYLLMKQLHSRGSSGCDYGEGSDLVEITMGAGGSGLNFQGDPKGMSAQDMRIDVDSRFTFTIDNDPNDNNVPPRKLKVLRGLNGGIRLSPGSGGGISFQSVGAGEIQLKFALGEKESYLGGSARMRQSNMEFAGGLFVGKSCSLQPIVSFDREAAQTLGRAEAAGFGGVYAFAEGSIPLNRLLGIPESCVLELIASGGYTFFLAVEEPPMLGMRFKARAHGQVICLIGVNAGYDILGRKTGLQIDEGWFAEGSFTAGATIGPCPFCIKPKATLTLTYDNGKFRHRF
jgi:hypothetical protein